MAKTYSPWPPGPEPSLQDERARIFRQHMSEYENAVRAGNLLAIVDAMIDCVELKMPPPAWLAGAVKALVARQLAVRSGRGNMNSRGAVLKADAKHYARWDAVTEVLERGIEKKQDAAFKAAAHILKGKPEAGSKGTIERSYRRVEKKMARGLGGAFYPTHTKAD
jgi:hypothetical protein